VIRNKLLNIKKKFIKNLGAPYSNCRKDLNGLESSIHDLFDKNNKNYRRVDCLYFLIQNASINNCGCALVYLPNYQNHTKYCNFYDYCNVISKIDHLLCDVECDSVDYDLTISSSGSSSTLKHDIEKYFEFYQKPFESNQLDSIASIYSIVVYYSDLEYTEISQLPKYTLISLISNIGGAFGLFLGMSLLSFFEIAEIIFQAFITKLVTKKKFHL
jgi:hypothetical protein